MSEPMGRVAAALVAAFGRATNGRATRARATAISFGGAPIVRPTRATVAATLAAAFGLATFFGCGKPPKPAPPAPENDKKPPTVFVENGLTPAERERFYHVDEGGEIIPLSWLRALESAETKRPFLENIERLGLVPDADNPDGLPVGVTAGETRDLRFMGRMIGLNCAACHVGQLTYKGRAVRVDGAPNMFDTQAFQDDIGNSIKATVTSPRKLVAFIGRLINRREYRDQLATTRPAAAEIGDHHEDLDQMKKAGAMEEDLAEYIESLHETELARPDVDLADDLDVKKNVQDPAAATIMLDPLRHDLSDVLDEEPAANHPLAKIEAGPKRHSALVEYLEHLRETIHLLKARVKLIEKLSGQSHLASTAEGPGRSDAWAKIRNQLFPTEYAIDKVQPLSFPPIWGLGRLTWIHYDGNTTSVMDRNIGQALGTGALFDPDTYESTLPPRQLHELEQLTRKLKPPAWPKEVFGEIDQPKAARGAKLFTEHCVKCHMTDDGQWPDLSFSLDAIGTDANRAVLMEKSAGSQSFAEALDQTAKKYKDWAYKHHGVNAEEASKMEGPLPAQWRATGKYAPRPLAGAWATAPYLHNGSVPTMYDLLKPAAERPKSFAVGHREFDPVKMGYAATVPGKPKFTFDTAQSGNHNTGHEYGANLTDAERMDLIEYLKGL